MYIFFKIASISLAILGLTIAEGSAAPSVQKKQGASTTKLSKKASPARSASAKEPVSPKKAIPPVSKGSKQRSSMGCKATDLDGNNIPRVTDPTVVAALSCALPGHSGEPVIFNAAIPPKPILTDPAAQEASKALDGMNDAVAEAQTDPEKAKKMIVDLKKVRKELDQKIGALYRALGDKAPIGKKKKRAKMEAPRATAGKKKPTKPQQSAKRVVEEDSDENQEEETAPTANDDE